MSEVEKVCAYYFRFREQDGGWSQWFLCSLTDYAAFRTDPELQVKIEPKATP